MTTVFKVNPPAKYNMNGFNSLFENLLKDVPTSANRFNPAVNISETKDSFLLEINAPGRVKEQFNISLDKNLLTISHKPEEVKADENVKQIRNEFSILPFSRTFTIDEKLVADNISAKYENGILSVVLPKKEEVKVSPKQITIQ